MLVSTCLNMSQSPFVQCCDCSFIAASQGHLGVHRSKMHRSDVDANIKTVSITRLFSEGKSHYCCLCNNIIASFPNFKRHFATTHKGIVLKVSAKCLFCDREFVKSSGVRVHLKRAHQIGKDDPFPVSPSPVMSYVDMELTQNNSTFNSTRCRRSQRLTLLNSSLSGITTCPSSNGGSTVDSQYVNTSLTCPSTPISPQRSPPPVLSDIDPDDVEDIPSPFPPRPSSSLLPHLVLDSAPLVPLNGSTDWNIDADTSISSGQTPSLFTPLPSTISPSTIQLSPEPSVALSGCTVENVDLNCSLDIPPSSPSTPHSQQPPPPRSIPSSVDAFVVDLPTLNDMSTTCPPHITESADPVNNFQAKWSTVFSENV